MYQPATTVPPLSDSATEVNNRSSLQDTHAPTALYLAGIPVTVTDAELQSAMSEYGVVNAVKVLRHLRTGVSKGKALVRFNQCVEAEAAKTAIETHGLFGCQSVMVQWVRTVGQPAGQSVGAGGM